MAKNQADAKQHKQQEHAIDEVSLQTKRVHLLIKGRHTWLCVLMICALIAFLLWLGVEIVGSEEIIEWLSMTGK